MVDGLELVDTDLFRAGGRPPTTAVMTGVDSACSRFGAEANAATVGRCGFCESVEELGVARVAELTVAIEGVEFDICLGDHNYGADNL